MNDFMEACCKVRTKGEAAALLEVFVDEAAEECDKSRDELRDIIRENIGYCAGYLNTNDTKRVMELFEARHPVLGTYEEMCRLTPEQIFNMGMELGRSLGGSSKGAQ